VDASVAVNVSARSLDDLSFAKRAIEVTERHGLEPDHVVFEVTESHALGEDGKAIENLLRLRLQGFGISIDDYGTGYSSLQQLARFAFSEIKIDQSFVRGATAREASRIILESSLEMARRLGVVAVAEGVETHAEWMMLHSLDCALAQGYLIAAPMPGETFLEWARGRN
jgi:EAL domain-containing protein (putative c-di-GMP-specific phosphodiesterase class I)